METMPRRELHALQLRRLQQTVRRVYDHVSFMRGHLDETGVRPDRVKTLDDLRRLPFTRKSDFRDTYPFGLLAVRVSQLVRIHASSGTTGKPTVVGYTSGDLRVWTEAMRDEIERRLGITAVNIYGLSEVIGPGVSNECIEEQNGAHIFEDHFLPEVINPQTEEPVPFGEIGELVFTTLTKEALPVIRYRTGDLASLDPTPCRCGRTFVRMSRIMGRMDDMLIIRGVNVYPTQVEAALLRVAELSPHYQLVVTRPRTLDELDVSIEVNDSFAKALGGSFTGEEEAVQGLTIRCQQKLLGGLGVTARVRLVPPGKLPRSEGGKLRRVVDQRKL